MINSLRKKFIIATMIAVIIVFTVILGIINIVNYVRVTQDTDNVINFMATVNGNFDGFIKEDEVPQNPGEGEFKPDQGRREDYQKSMNDFKIDKETPYSTRYFTVNIDDNNQVVSTDTSHVVISQEEAITLTNKVLSSSKSTGYVSNYRYRVVDDQNMIIFVDSTNQLATVKSFLLISAIVALAGILGIFVLVVLLSYRVVKPIAESYEKQKQFITDASHELKTPLTIISANNELTEMEFGESQSTKAISKQVSRMTSMVKNLTALARLDEAQNAEKVEMNLSNLVSDMVELFRPAITQDERLFETNIQENVQYFGDEKLIRQLISVVLENASKYAKTKTVFNLSTQGQKAVILVQNDAEGIVPGDLSKCFERFYRESTTRASGKEGSGIGLSIAKEIVKLHNGTITAYGDENSNFNIKIVI